MSEFKGLSSEQMKQLIRDESAKSIKQLFLEPTSEKRHAMWEESRRRVVAISNAHKEQFGTYGLYEVMADDDKKKRDLST